MTDIFKIKELASTPVRVLVYEYLIEHQKALSLKYIESDLYDLDRSSIFRTLKTFVDHKIVHTIHDGSGSVKYALCQEGCNCDPSDLHFHFYCTTCEATYCLLDLPVPLVSLPTGFVISQANMVLSGLCNNCNS